MTLARWQGSSSLILQKSSFSRIRDHSWLCLVTCYRVTPR